MANGEIDVKVKLTPKQAGAMFMKNVELKKQVEILGDRLQSIQDQIDGFDQTEDKTDSDTESLITAIYQLTEVD